VIIFRNKKRPVNKILGNHVIDKQTWRGTTRQIVISNSGIEAAGEIKKVVFNRKIK